jgi:hypothetical protein
MNVNKKTIERLVLDANGSESQLQTACSAFDACNSDEEREALATRLHKEYRLDEKAVQNKSLDDSGDTKSADDIAAPEKKVVSKTKRA